MAVHIRLGDYIQIRELYGNICTEEYYRKAIQYIAGRIENPVFYVFSDEPELPIIGNINLRLDSSLSEHLIKSVLKQLIAKSSLHSNNYHICCPCKISTCRQISALFPKKTDAILYGRQEMEEWEECLFYREMPGSF